MSLTTASKLEERAASRASRPVRAHVTRKPLSVSPVSRVNRIERSSSATRICGECSGIRRAIYFSGGKLWGATSPAPTVVFIHLAYHAFLQIQNSFEDGRLALDRLQ